jgi:DNA-binding GntR family transcriptional regulator
MAQPSISATLRRRLERFTRPGVPKYVALRDALADAIASGDWPERARLPTESEYAAALPLSLGTIQRALRALADEGLITRQQGQGSFVAANGAARMHAPLHCRFVNDAGDGYLPVYPEVLARYAEAREGPWSRHLGSASILCIERALRIGEEFRVFSRFWCDPVRLPSLAALPFRKLSGENFKDVVWRDTRQLVGRISTFLSTVALPAEACRAIGARRGARGQRLEISAFVGRDQPIYYQELYIPPNRRRLHLAADGRESGAGGKP